MSAKNKCGHKHWGPWLLNWFPVFLYRFCSRMQTCDHPPAKGCCYQKVEA